MLIQFPLKYLDTTPTQPCTMMVSTMAAAADYMDPHWIMAVVLGQDDMICVTLLIITLLVDFITDSVNKV